MIDHASIESLTAAVQRYFDLMYDGDTSRFDRVFVRPPNSTGFATARWRCSPPKDTRN